MIVCVDEVLCEIICNFFVCGSVLFLWLVIWLFGGCVVCLDDCLDVDVVWMV